MSSLQRRWEEHRRRRVLRSEGPSFIRILGLFAFMMSFGTMSTLLMVKLVERDSELGWTQICWWLVIIFPSIYYAVRGWTYGKEIRALEKENNRRWDEIFRRRKDGKGQDDAQA